MKRGDQAPGVTPWWPRSPSSVSSTTGSPSCFVLGCAL